MSTTPNPSGRTGSGRREGRTDSARTVAVAALLSASLARCWSRGAARLSYPHAPAPLPGVHVRLFVVTNVAIVIRAWICEPHHETPDLPPVAEGH